MTKMPDYAGLRQYRRSRITGTRVGVYNSVEAEIDTGEDAWAVVCEDHGAMVAMPTRRMAEESMGDPTMWCEDCRSVLDLPAVWATWRRLIHEVRAADPDFEATLAVSADAARPCCRQFAYCEDQSPARIVVAPSLDGQASDRIEGVLRHEFGHAVLFFAGRQHTEREADDAAETLWGTPIRYDSDDVQTIGAGVAPRPTHLG
ncbi:MAG: hypothetical protein EXR31_10440 [Betaproteobacteria bacterium]|nr:hypothetical protein [Betaproteobacteria bacterium]